MGKPMPGGPGILDGAVMLAGRLVRVAHRTACASLARLLADRVARRERDGAAPPPHSFLPPFPFSSR